jgi:precorrin-8X/cobalt-precorrin-8 methylmutase
LEDYIKDPHEIEKKSFEIIREVTDLSDFTEIQQQIVMRLVHTSGNPDVAQQVRMSANAINVGVEALNQNHAILCDVEMVKQGLTKRFLTQQPLCFLNHENTPKIASASGETRTMSALELWAPYLENSIIIIGNARGRFSKTRSHYWHAGWLCWCTGIKGLSVESSPEFRDRMHHAEGPCRR